MEDPKTTQLNKKERETSLDFLRGFAVFMMILAHAIFFFHDNTNLILNILGRTGNTICFTIFLFVSGASTYFAYLKDPQKNSSNSSKKIAKRSFYILFGYYVVAFVSRADSLLQTINFEEILTKTFNILILKDIPNFTEFLIPFFIYSLSLIILKPLYHKISKSLKLTLLISLLFYIAGYLLYPLNLSSPYLGLKALFAGDPNIIRFPILQYAPVFFLGIYWGNFLSHHESKTSREKFAYRSGITLVIFILISSFLSMQFPLALLDPLKRWPPSLTFLSIGLVIAILLYVVYINFQKIKFSSLFWKTLNYLGKDAFDLFTVHVLILYFYRYFYGKQFGNIFLVSFLFLLLLIMSIFISSLNWKISPSVFRLGPISIGKQKSYRPKKRHVLPAFIFILIVIWNLNYSQNATTVGESIDPSEILGSDLKPLKEITDSDLDSGLFPWFDSNYGNFKQITLTNESPYLPIDQGQKVEINFDHQKLIQEHKSQRDGSDLTLVYLKDNKYQIIPLTLQNLETSNAILSFKITEKIYPQKLDNRYFLYYNSDFPIPQENLQTEIKISNKYTSALSVEFSQQYLPQLNRKWYVKSAPSSTTLIPPTLSLETRNNDGSPIYYQIENTNDKIEMLKITDNLYQSNIIIDNLTAGKYTLTFFQNNENLNTKKLQFYVSEPVFVAWTFDWEGGDVPQNYLEAIENQVTKHYNLPITHFFNPRIYLPTVMNSERAEYLTNWVKNRSQNYGDEIELHLHMYHDMIKEIGLEIKKEPKWGSSQDGYDVMSTAYTYEDFMKILDWAKIEFRIHNLPTPLGYRAGGWFADLEILQALEDTGFLYDSSGREHYLWNNQLQSPWDLNATTQPYYPSKQDQNQTGNNNFELLEIPNNGGDSWAYNAPQLITRFKENFDGTPSENLKLITYLSHPEWFQSRESQDETKMEEVLTEIDKFLYQEDTGPVFYVTLKQAYDIWNN